MSTKESTKQVVNLDWLSFSVTLELTGGEREQDEYTLSTPHDMKIAKCRTGTPQYRNRYYVLDHKGDKVFTLLTHPYASIIDPRNMFVEVANSFLYTSSHFNWVFPILAGIHQFTFQSLSRIDIACDFNPSQTQYDIIAAITCHSIYCGGKREGSIFCDYVSTSEGNNIRQARCISWGSKNSDCKWKLYDKVKEIKQLDKSGKTWWDKPYIVEFWMLNGLDVNSVWRLEVSLTSASTYVWRDEKLGWNVLTMDVNLFSKPRWITLFWDLYLSRFTLRRNEGHQCKKNDTIVEFLEVPEQDMERVREKEGAKRDRHVALSSTIRNLVKELDKCEVAANEVARQSLLETLYTIINVGHLEGYFAAMVGKRFEEWAAEIGTTLVE